MDAAKVTISVGSGKDSPFVEIGPVVLRKALRAIPLC
jgi:hypothetical protein